MSSLCIRMQPYDAILPIDSGLLVPWSGVFAARKGESRKAHWVVRRAPRDHVGQIWIIEPHLFGRGPRRAQVLARDLDLAIPLFGGTPNSNPITHCTSFTDDKVKPALGGLHDDRSRCDATFKTHHFASAGAASHAGRYDNPEHPGD